MESTRQQKISRLIQKELGDIFLQYARKTKGTLISVTGVTISSDLSIARVRLSIFPQNRVEPILQQIDAENKSFRYELGNRLRHQLRIIPELHFHLDDSLNYLENIDKLLAKENINSVDNAESAPNE